MGRPISNRASTLAIGGAIVAAVATLWLGARIGAGPAECQSGDWPAFMLTAEPGDFEERPGWILWCNESHWTMHVATSIAGETDSRNVRGDGQPPFPWFDPSLTPDEAWRALTGSDEKNMREPRNPLADTAFTIRTDLGQYRMEFSEEGIPVLVRVPGESGFRFSGRLIRAESLIWDDADVVDWPACSIPGQGGFINEPQPCWLDGGSARPGGRCYVTFGELTNTSGFQTLGCSL